MQALLEELRCTSLRGEDYELCYYFKKEFTSLCPNDWVAKWDDQREAGTYPHKICYVDGKWQFPPLPEE